jgi:S-adenosylmethionine hydrolase
MPNNPFPLRDRDPQFFKLYHSIQILNVAAGAFFTVSMRNLSPHSMVIVSIS